MRKSADRWMKHWDFILLDLLCMLVCALISTVLVRGMHNPFSVPLFRFQLSVLMGAQMLVIAFFETYNRIVRRNVFEEIIAVFKFAFATVFGVLAFLFIFHSSQEVSRLEYGLTIVLYFILDIVLRQANKRRILAGSHDRADKRTLVLITSSEQVREAMRKLYDRSTVRGFDVTGIVLMDEGADPELFADLKIPVYVIGEEAILYICHNHVDEVFILQTDNMIFPRRVVDIMTEMGIDVNYSNTLMERYTEYHRLGQFDVVTTTIRSASAGELLLKRVMDIVGGVVGCLLTGIIFLFIAPAIYKQSPGPIFFAQERVGKNGKIFKMYKFRSMYMDAEQRKADLMAKNRIHDGLMFKIDDDPRIIGSEKKDKNGKPAGIGNFIRNTSLDEFPQFFNVLKGDMSMVGTRPPTKDEWVKYNYHHRIRMSAKPGITGMWQVSGRSQITDFNQVVALDRYYIEHWSLALDIKILFKTVSTVIKHDGAF